MNLVRDTQKNPSGKIESVVEVYATARKNNVSVGEVVRYLRSWGYVSAGYDNAETGETYMVTK